MRKRHSLIALLLSGSAAFAQSPAPAAPSEVMLEPMTLSAARRPQEIARSGVSVSVLETAELERAGAVPLADVLARLPGVSVTRNGPDGGYTSLRIRGAEPRQIAVYIDGMRVNDPTTIAGEFDFGALSTADVARVEVLRGAQGAVWGGQAMGGVIHITSRSPEEGDPRHSLSVEGGSRGHVSLTTRLQQQTGRAATVWSLSHHRSDGFSARDTLPRSPGLERDGHSQSRLSFATRFQAGPDLVIGASGFVQHARSDYDSSGWDGVAQVELPLPNSDSRAARRETGGRLFAEFTHGETEHLLDLGFYRIDRSLQDAGYGGTSHYSGQRQTLNWQAATALSPGLHLVYGADLSQERAEFPGTAPQVKSRTGGAFAQLLWQPQEGFDVNASLRRDDHSRFGGHSSGRLAFAFAVSDTVSLRGALATGYLAPSLYQMFGDDYVTPNPGLTPERSRSAELGFDYRSAGAGLGLTLFRLDSDNAIDWLGSGYANLPGRSRRQGAEVTAALALNDAWRLSGAYTYTEARGPNGTRLGRVPRHSLSLALQGDLSARLSLEGQLLALAGRPRDAGQAMGSYAVFNAGVSYALSAETRLTARVENLTNRDYQSVAGYGTPPRGLYLGLSTRF